MSMPTAMTIRGPAAWRGEDLARTTDWIRPITDTEIEEMDAALRAVQRRDLDWPRMTRDDSTCGQRSARSSATR